jgi:hypothetical protein
LVIAAAVGARRGWGREVITCAIILGTVLFLSNGGGNYIATFLSQGLHNTSGTAAAACNTVNPQMLSTLVFGGMTWLGYAVGSKYGTAPKSHNHRIAGTIPGAINGASLAYYASNSILPGNSVLLNTPSSAFSNTYLPEVFGLGLLGLLAVLFIAAQASKK